MIRVLFMSTSYPRNAGDWRGVFIRHLAGGLARSGEIRLKIWAPPGELPHGVESVVLPGEAGWLNSLMADGGIAHVIRSGGVDAVRRPGRLLQMLRGVYRREKQIDLYHVNWLQTALPLPRDGKPALITVLGTDLKLLRLPLMARLLRRAMKGRRVVICPNAEWMKEPLEVAFTDAAQVHPVPFGIDPMWYRIHRELDPDLPAWLVVTRLTRDKLGPLFDWSAKLFRGAGRRLHIFGPMQEAVDVPEWVEYHGPATAEELAGKWFPRAHGLITLSRHAEGRPQVMLEAMAAGLPIIASDMPAHAGLVRDGVTGALCRDEEGYARALARLEDAEMNQRSGEAGRDWVLREIGTWDDCAQRYIRLYKSLLAGDDV